GCSRSWGVRCPDCGSLSARSCLRTAEYWLRGRTELEGGLAPPSRPKSRAQPALHVGRWLLREATIMEAPQIFFFPDRTHVYLISVGKPCGCYPNAVNGNEQDDEFEIAHD